jgi:hypothetical protein
MSYTKEPKFLVGLIERAFSNPGIADLVKETGVNDSNIADEVMKAPDEVWKAAEAEISEYDQIDALLQQAKERAKAACWKKRSLSQSTRQWFVKVFGWITFLAFIFAAYCVLAYKYSFPNISPEALGGRWLTIVIGAVAITILVFWIWVVIDRRTWGKFTEVEPSAMEYERQLGLQGVSDIGINLETAKHTIDAKLLEGISQSINEIIHRLTGRNYDTTLQQTRPEGLGEVHDYRHVIITEPLRRVKDMLGGGMPGGALGVAGPRGAGKSTLLRSVLDDKRRPDRITVYTTAPVKYEARDFILNLFASVCSKVLSAESKAEHPPDLMPLTDLSISPALNFLRVLLPALFVICTIVAFVLTMVASDIASHPVQEVTAVSRVEEPISQASATAPAPAADTKPAPATAQNTIPATRSGAQNSIAPSLKALGITPRDVARTCAWAWCAVLITILVMVGVQASSSRRVSFPFPPFPPFQRPHRLVRDPYLQYRLNEDEARSKALEAVMENPVALRALKLLE